MSSKLLGLLEQVRLQDELLAEELKSELTRQNLLPSQISNDILKDFQDFIQKNITPSPITVTTYPIVSPSYPTVHWYINTSDSTGNENPYGTPKNNSSNPNSSISYGSPLSLFPYRGY